MPAGNERKSSNFTNSDYETEAFRKLLGAMDKPYTINTPEELESSPLSQTFTVPTQFFH
jgi:hypothetical protein